MTGPLCWATTVVQGDSITLRSTRTIVAELHEYWDRVSNEAQGMPESVRDTMLKLASFASERLDVRREAYLTNEITNALAALENTTYSTEAGDYYDDFQALGDVIKRYCTTTGIATGDIPAQMQRYCFRHTEEIRKSDTDSYWDSPSTKANFPTVAKFRADMMQILVTEASVERSFQRQGDIWSPRRNRLQPDAIDDSMFIAMNYAQFRLQKPKNPKPPRTRKTDVSPEVWTSTLLSLCSAVPTHQPRPQRVKANPKDIDVGKKVEVQFLVDGEYEFFKGVVVEVLDDEAREFKVCWQKYAVKKDQVTVFRPLTKDTVWKFWV